MSNENEKVEFPWRILGQSVLGASHTRSGLPNQDAILWKQNPKKGVPLILAIADGHGSEKYFRSDTGAQFAVQAAEQEMQNFLRGVATHSISTIEDLAEQLPRNIVGRWNELVEEHWIDNPLTKKEWQWFTKRENVKARKDIGENHTIPYGTTLLTVVVTETFILYLQLGDGDILTVFTSGKVIAPIPGDKRHLANETTSLCTPDAARNFRSHFQKLVRRRPALIMVSTDGYSNCFRDKEGFFKVGLDIWEIIRNEESGLKKVEESLEGWLTKATQTGSGDDITLGLLCRMDALMEPVEVEEEKKPVIDSIEPIKGDKQTVSVGNKSQPAGANSSKSNLSSPPSSSSVSANMAVVNQPTPTAGDGSTASSGMTNPQGYALDQIRPEVDRGVGDKELSRMQSTTLDKSTPSPPLTSTSQELIVSPDKGAGDYTSISEAIKNASRYALIRVQPGIYKENLFIDKPITIVGDGFNVVIESKVPCLQIENDQVLLSNLTVCGQANPDKEDYPAIDIFRAQPTLKDCDITSESIICVGIRGNGADPEFVKCHIHGGRGRGLLFTDEARGLVENCIITDNTNSGVVILKQAHPRLKECFITCNKGYAIEVDQAAQAIVEDCDLTGNKDGPWYIDPSCEVIRHRNIEKQSL
jgi:Protein phosphatase 2C/Right handed beta helix region